MKIQAFDQKNNKTGEIDGYMDGKKTIAISSDVLQNLIKPQTLSSKAYTPKYGKGWANRIEDLLELYFDGDYK